MKSDANLPAYLAIVVAMFCASAGPDQAPPPPPEPEKKDELSQRLIRKAATDTPWEDPMDEILRLMEETGRKLEIDFDAGKETQGMQSRITARLDEAIKAAAAQRRSVPQPAPTAKGDKRTMPEGAENSQERQNDGESGAADASSTGGASAAPSDAGASGGSLHEQRRAWGHLPARERQEVIQGIGEEFLERYRTWIDQYYRALQETKE